MQATRFTRIGGLSAVLGGFVWLATLALAQLISPDVDLLLPGAVLPIALGALALQARHRGRMGSLGTAGFLIALVGTVVLAFGSVGDAVISATVAGITLTPIRVGGLAPGALLLGIGVTLSSIAAIRADVLPRLSPIVLAIGSCGVVAAGGATLLRWWTGTSVGDVLPFELLPLAALWALFGAGWVWLGFLLWSEPLPPDVVR